MVRSPHGVMMCNGLLNGCVTVGACTNGMRIATAFDSAMNIYISVLYCLIMTFIHDRDRIPVRLNNIDKVCNGVDVTALLL